MQSVSKFLLFLVLNEAQHVSGDTPLIIRSLKLHKQTLVLHTCKVVGRCQVAYATWQRPTTARPTTFHVCKTRGCLCSFRLLMMGGVSPETCWASFKIRNNKILIHCCILFGFSLQELAVLFSSVPPSKCRNITFNYDTTASFHIPSNFSCNSHTTIRAT